MGSQKRSKNSQERKNFIMKNESFACNYCGKENDPLKGGCRNHCKYCLYSKHVDDKIPGDRESKCGQLMQPLELDNSGSKGYVIVHKCTKCGKEIRNKTAPDDSIEAIIALSKHKEL
ncbi:RNHCP domain-containing protein [bacterium]|nr:RNHCP domain-containing protein [bacterium]